MVGVIAFSDKELAAFEYETVFRTPCRRSDGIRVVMIPFIEGDRQQNLATGNAGQEALASLVVVANDQRGCTDSR